MTSTLKYWILLFPPRPAEHHSGSREKPRLRNQQKPLGESERSPAGGSPLRSGITLAVNQNMRYDPSIRAAKTLLEGDQIGPDLYDHRHARHPPGCMAKGPGVGHFAYHVHSPSGLFSVLVRRPGPSIVVFDPTPHRFEHQDGIATF